MIAKKLLIGGCLAVCVAACATNPPAPKVAKAADTPPPAGCVAETATRLPMTAHQCAAFGRSFSGDDLRATGTFDVGSGLKMLDPSVSTNGVP